MIAIDTEFDDKRHVDCASNTLAHEMNIVLARAKYVLETTNDESDKEFARAVQNLCEHVALDCDVLTVEEIDEIKSLQRKQPELPPLPA